MLFVKNKTPLVHAMFPYTDHCDQNFVSVVVKGTFDLAADGSLKLSEEQEALLESDQYKGEDSDATLLREADYCPLKPACDLFILGDIISPEEKPCRQMDAFVSVADHQRIIRASGERYWHRQGLSHVASAPEAFTRIPLTPENAFGGRDTAAEQVDAERYPFNPAGKGFVSKGSPEGITLPNLEDPQHLISAPEDKPKPHYPAYVNKSWLPRSNLAGTCDKNWEANRMPLLPRDFDNGFYNAATPDFIFPLMKGGEPVVLQGFAPEGPLSFKLPNWDMKIKYCIKNDILEARSKIDTVTILSKQKQVVVNWRSCFPCGQDFLYIKWMEIKAVYV